MRKVTLSPLEPSHAEAMFRWTSEPEVADGLRGRRVTALTMERLWTDES
jgi:hypothetical protein